MSNQLDKLQYQRAMAKDLQKHQLVTNAVEGVVSIVSNHQQLLATREQTTQLRNELQSQERQSANALEKAKVEATRDMQTAAQQKEIEIAKIQADAKRHTEQIQEKIHQTLMESSHSDDSIKERQRLWKEAITHMENVSEPTVYAELLPADKKEFK